MSWCWQADGHWNFYEDVFDQAIEQAFLSRQPATVLDVYGTNYRVDFSLMMQINEASGFQRKIWRCSEKVPQGMQVYQWVSEKEEFDLVTCAYLSLCRQLNRPRAVYHHRHKAYEVDLTTMMRTSRSNGRTRKVAVVDVIPPLDIAQGMLDSEVVDETPESSDEMCSICLDGFSTQPGIRLIDCRGHWFHKDCLSRAFDVKPKCPMCGTQYGPSFGTQPPGQMTVSKIKNEALPGFEGVGIIQINYVIPSGFQSEVHPHPMHPYMGTSRTGYLPDNAEGAEVLKALKAAWRQRVVFTVGQSMTTGLDDCVIWNGIHHKTSMHGGQSAHGYPDDTYLACVKEELAAFGIRTDSMEVDE